MHTEGIEERTAEDGSQQWFIRSECRGCGLKIGADVPAGDVNGLVDRLLWTDDARHRLERMPPYLAPLFKDEVERDARARGERVVTYDSLLQPRGVAVVVEATHHCMTTRGVHKPGVTMVTSRMLGAFRNDAATRREFLAMVGDPASRRTAAP